MKGTSNYAGTVCIPTILSHCYALGPQCSLSIIVALHLSQSAPDQSPYLSLACRLNGAHLFRSQLIQPPVSHSRFARWFLSALQHSTLGWFNPACSWPGKLWYSSFRLTNSLPVAVLLSSSRPLIYSSLRIINLWNYLNRNWFLRTQGHSLSAVSGSSFCPWQYLFPSQT